MWFYCKPEVEFCAGIFLFVWLWRVFLIILIIHKLQNVKDSSSGIAMLLIDYKSSKNSKTTIFTNIFKRILKVEWVFINSVCDLAFTSYYKDTFTCTATVVAKY
jgi:hypothetical protein